MPKAADVYNKRILKQKAIYWPEIGRNEFGQPIYGDPEECNVRWEDCRKRFLNKQGQEEVSRSEVYVDRDMTLDGVLWLGSLNDIEDLEDPFANDNSWSIRYFRKIPNRLGTKFVRIATL